MHVVFQGRVSRIYSFGDLLVKNCDARSQYKSVLLTLLLVFDFASHPNVKLLHNSRGTTLFLGYFYPLIDRFYLHSRECVLPEARG